MEKIFLNLAQTKALNRMKEGFALDPRNSTDGTYVGRFQVASEFTQSATETLGALESSIADVITKVYDGKYGESVERAEDILNKLTMLKEQITLIEENAAAAIHAIDKLTEKSYLTWLISDDEILKEINCTDSETKNTYLECDNNKIYMIFENEITKKLLIATGNENDFIEVEKHINDILG